MQDFKATANQANQLLASLQASADSIKELVRYEVAKALRAEREANKVEMDEMRARLRVLEGGEGGEVGEQGKGKGQEGAGEREGEKEKEKERERDGKAGGKKDQAKDKEMVA